MPTVADYDIVNVISITLSADPAKGHSTMDFDLETPGIKVDVRTVLSFMLNTTGIEFTMSIVNGKDRTLLREFKVSNPGVIQNVIDAGVLQTTGNKLRIEVIEGFGKIRDTVLWYQTNV